MQLSRSRSRRAAVGAALVLCVVATLVGCAPPQLLPTPSASPSYVSTYETPAPTGLAPLTGVEVPAESLTTPSLAAKIDNHVAARPQFGLNHTDLVFEELVEGGLTRYVAVWHSDLPAEIGPIRSIRPMDPDIVSPLGGIIAYSGGQPRFKQLMMNTPVYNAVHDNIGERSGIMYRTRERAGPHNVMVRTAELLAMVGPLAPPRQQFSFAADLASLSALRGGAPTTGMDLRFSNSSRRGWTFDTASQSYLRTTDGNADTDETGAQLHAVNVVVIRVSISTGLGVPKTELIGGGEAWVSSGGSTIHATWSKGSATDLIRLVDDTGTVIRLAPGNSWIELVPLAGAADFVAAPAA